MKKIKLLLIACCLVGCQSSKNDNNQREKYENYMELLIDNKDETSANIPFSWELDMNQINENKYEYSLAIKDPKVAMYNIRMLAVDINAISESEIAPSLGIVEDDKYNMVPYQINQEKNYYGGVVLTSTSLESKFRIYALVYYLDKNQNENYVYFHVDADYENFKEVEETPQGENE